MDEALKRHHDKMDDIIQRSGKTLHELVDKAYSCGALNTEFKDPEKYLLVMAVFTIYAETAYNPTSTSHKRQHANLRHFIP